MDRKGLADYLKVRRARVRPGDVGLEAGTRRRTPGLRREEVARLAGISVDYYIRLEQARGPHPSRQVLGSLARALRLHDDERAHLFHLAGEEPDVAGGPPQDVPVGIVYLLERLDDTPAFVMDAKYDILAWNDMAAALIADFSAYPPRERNVIRWACAAGLDGATPEHERFVRECLADLRIAAARYPADTGVRELIAEVNAVPAFAAIWREHEVRTRRGTVKHMDHPVVGPLDMHCDVLHVPDRDQRVVLYTAEPGSRTAEALRLLRVVGTQDLSAARA
jgi:transcriptional regulator with XRE-family HTH domain